jgi:hypothetical protein
MYSWDQLSFGNRRTKFAQVADVIGFGADKIQLAAKPIREMEIQLAAKPIREMEIQ